MLTLQTSYSRGLERVMLYIYFPLRSVHSLSVCTKGYRVFLGGRVRMGIMLTLHTF
jgi:hypothetical protein